MLTMMRDQCERLLAKVNSRDRPVVENQIASLDDKLVRAHNLKAEQEAFAAASQPEVNKCSLHARQGRLLHPYILPGLSVGYYLLDRDKPLWANGTVCFHSKTT